MLLLFYTAIKRVVWATTAAAETRRKKHTTKQFLKDACMHWMSYMAIEHVKYYIQNIKACVCELHLLFKQWRKSGGTGITKWNKTTKKHDRNSFFSYMTVCHFIEFVNMLYGMMLMLIASNAFLIGIKFESNVLLSKNVNQFEMRLFWEEIRWSH